MSLTVKFLIALMGLAAALITYQTELLRFGVTDADSTPPSVEQPYLDWDKAPAEDGECVYAGGYDACSGSR